MPEHSEQKLIESAADMHDVDLDQAVVATDTHPASDRIYILEGGETGSYRLIAYGLDAAGDPANEDPITIPRTALDGIGMLFHAANLQRSHNLLAEEEGEEGLGLREVSEGFGISEPLDAGDDSPFSGSTPARHQADRQDEQGER